VRSDAFHHHAPRQPIVTVTRRRDRTARGKRANSDRRHNAADLPRTDAFSHRSTSLPLAKLDGERPYDRSRALM
jgi:hypothetical protein